MSRNTEWDQRLAQDGLAPIRGAYASPTATGPVRTPDLGAHVEAYQRWAAQIDLTPYNTFHRRVWRMHAQQLSHADIADRLHCTVSRVRRVVDRIVAANPGGPRNVHDKRHRDHGPRQPEPTRSITELASSADPALLGDLITISVDLLREYGLLDAFEARVLGLPAFADLLRRDDTSDDEPPARIVEKVRLPMDSVSCAEGSGPVKHFSRREIARLNQQLKDHTK